MKRFTAVALLAGCAGILGLRAGGPHPFEHRAHTLRGVSCLTCHSGVDKAGELGALHLPDDASCLTCHKNPHDTRSCTSCHGGMPAAQAAADARRHLRFEHAVHVPIAMNNCARCHSDVARDAAFLRPQMATCFGCHEHADDWESRTCESCHVDLPGERVRPESHVVHDGDFVREHGVRAASQRDLCATCHSERFCGSCHGATVPELPARLAFDAPHRDSVHRAGFFARHSDEARADPGLCTTCHRQESCLGCHSERGVASSAQTPARSPHPPGWVSVRDGGHGSAARRDPAGCASCHGGAGEALCVSCHQVGGVGGNPHPPGFSSQKPMHSLPCRLCHAVGAP